MSHDVVIAIGSNIHPEQHVPRAVRLLEGILEAPRAANVYKTPAIDRPEQPGYWNTAVRGRTILGPRTLKAALRRIEADLGRVRTWDRYAPRTIDLDEIWRDGRVTDQDVEKREFLQQCLHDLDVTTLPTIHL
ncbi:MAG: 2-amino-4-hydroxy-6-hydroxymethyldihydropteridine diphosphokinase [Thermoplasmatota archaeon]